MAFGAHPAVGEDLRDRVLGRRALFSLIGIAQRTDIIHRMVVADVLQRIGYGCDHIGFTDYRHERLQTCATSLPGALAGEDARSEEHTSELQSLMRISYAVFCLKKKNKKQNNNSLYNS